MTCCGMLAAVGARGLAMALNRIVDRDIDAANPRTQGRHLASGSMSLRTAWTLSAVFLFMLLIDASLLNPVALMMAWLPVLAFVIYPYMKRFTWLCHLWLGFCLALAPAGAWVAIAADVHGWAAITGMLPTRTEFLWAPTILPVSLGVALWISAFDINYARMDMESDQEHPASIPSLHGSETRRQLARPSNSPYFGSRASPSPIPCRDRGSCWLRHPWHSPTSSSCFEGALADFGTMLFRVSMLTGWVLLASLALGFAVEPPTLD